MNCVSQIKDEFQFRVFEESYPRIQKCLESLEQKEIWSSPNENIVSVGCLVKHLLGNIQQWMYAGVLGGAYQRDRNSEFVAESELTAENLIDEMNRVREVIDNKMKGLTDDRLNESLEIQGFKTTGLSAIIHVIEHFSYHTGQISLLTKLYRNEDLGYYSDFNLDLK